MTGPPSGGFFVSLAAGAVTVTGGGDLAEVDELLLAIDAAATMGRRLCAAHSGCD